MLQFDLVQLSSDFGGSGVNVSSISDIINTTLTQGILNATDNLPPGATINVTAILNGFGIKIPSGTQVQGFSLDFFPIGLIPRPLLKQVISQIADRVVEQIPMLLAPSIKLRVAGAIGDPDGKFPHALGNVMYLEMNGIASNLKKLVPQNLTLLENILTSLQQGGLGNFSGNGIEGLDMLRKVLQSVQSLDESNIRDYALMVIGMFRNRYGVYLQDKQLLKDSVSQMTNDIFEQIGVSFPAVPTAPIVDALKGVMFAKLFLDQIFGSVMAFLVVLGSILIYSLLLGNVSDKTYEYGMLRALGFKRNSLIGLLFISSILFVIPGISLGLLCAWLLYVPIDVAFQMLTSGPAEYSLDWSAVVLGIAVGLVMPLASNIGPIRRALSRSLRDSLDIYHSVQSETTVQMVKLSSMGLSLWQLLIATTLVVAGFLVYYVIPYSFTYENWGLFLGIMNLILLAMVMGLCTIATTLQPALEQALLYVLCWGEDRKMIPLIRKNFSAHRPRNQKTALMFTLSLGFIIFAGASFSLQATTVGDEITSLMGGDISIFGPRWDVPLPAKEFRQVLDVEMAREGSLVLGYDFATYPLHRFAQVYNTYIGNLAAEPFLPVHIYGIERNHLKVVHDKFYIATAWDSSISYSSKAGSYPDVIESLYLQAGQTKLPIEKTGLEVSDTIISNEGNPYYLDQRNQTTIYKDYVDLILSEAMRPGATVGLNTPLRVAIDYVDARNSKVRFQYLGKVRAFVSKVSGYFFSSYQQTAKSSEVLVSTDNFMVWMHEINEIQARTRATDFVNITEPHFQRLWVRMHDKATIEDLDAVIAKLKNFIVNDGIQVFNVRNLVAGTSTASNAMIIFFNVVAVINSTLSFFLLWLSFDANVRFNSWEFGVLRSLGISANQVTRLYIYEALSLVITSLLLGTIVGLLVSCTLTLQFNLFLENPFQFEFPTTIFVSVLVISLVLSVAGSYLPASRFGTKPISSVLRGL